MPEGTRLFLGAFDLTCSTSPATSGPTPMKAKLLSNFCSITIPANKF